MNRKDRKLEAEKRRRYQQEEWNNILLDRTTKGIPIRVAFDSLRQDVADDCANNPQEKSEIIRAWNDYVTMLNKEFKEVVS